MESMRRNIKKLGWIIALALVILVLAAQTVPVQAATGSLSIVYHGTTPEGEQTPLAGAVFTIYKAGVRDGGFWTLTGDFAGAGVSLDELKSSEQKKTAEALYTFARNNGVQGRTATTDQEGRVTFAGLEEGLYLVAPAGETAVGDNRFRSAPFLAELPEVDETGAALYDVTVEPKTEWVWTDPDNVEGYGPPEEDEDTSYHKRTKTEKKKEETVEDEESGGGSSRQGSSSSGQSAKTGDDNPVEIYAGLLAVSAAAILIWLLCRKKRK